MSSTLFAREEGALAPPSGVTPNFIDPPNRDAQIRALSYIAIVVSTLFTVARVYTRFFVIKRRGWEDYLLLTAWLLSLIFMLMSPMAIPYGGGLHLWDVEKAQYLEFSKRANIADVVYSPVICMVKLAILVQLLHIFAPTRTRMHWIIVCISAMTVIFYLAVMLFRIFACMPREKIWNPEVPGTCIVNSDAQIVSTAALNVLSDFVLLILPLARIWQLQIPTHKKWAISTVFATGLFGCAASIMRLVASVKLLQDGDVTYQIITVALWCDAEMASGIVCCCLPVLPQLYRAHVSKLISSLNSRLRNRLSAGASNDTGIVLTGASESTVDSVAAHKEGFVTYLSSTKSEAGYGGLDGDAEAGHIRATKTIAIVTYPVK